MTVSNISFEAPRAFVSRFYIEPSGAKGTKICSNGSGHMTNMVAMPVDSINFKKSSSLEPVD